MQNFNFHTHTYRCKHAIGRDEEYVIEAIKAGVKVLGFSDHMPFRNVSLGKMSTEESVEYLKSIKSLQAKYANQIVIKIGYECEYFKEYHNHYIQLLSQVDYLILGQHCVGFDDTDLRFSSGCPDDYIDIYTNDVCEGIASGLFTYLAHPCYFMSARDEWNSHCSTAIEKICQYSNIYHVPLEINLKGMDLGMVNYPSGPSYPYPNFNALPIFEKYQVQCVFGVDAHDPKKFRSMESKILQFFNETSDIHLNFVSDLPLINPVKQKK